jgi:hypothetical protein
MYSVAAAKMHPPRKIMMRNFSFAERARWVNIGNGKNIRKCTILSSPIPKKSFGVSGKLDGLIKHRMHTVAMYVHSAEI